MSAINELPRDRDFGKGFDYTQWSGKNSYASLHTVPWDNSYRDVVRFNDTEGLISYLDTVKQYEGFNFSYLKPNQPVRLDAPYNTVIKSNYLRVYNAEQPVPGDNGRWYFYFITDVVYGSPQSTHVHLQLDVWQTFIYNIQFGRSYAEQGHVGLSVTEGQDPYCDAYLTVPEPHDLGSDYQIAGSGLGHLVMGAGNEQFYEIMILSTTDLEASPGSLDNPQLKTATGSTIANLSNGANIYILPSVAEFQTFMTNISEYPWVAQGIISITAIPANSFYEVGDPFPSNAVIYGVQSFKATSESSYNFKREKRPFGDQNLRTVILNLLPAKYRHLRKFATAPYTFIEHTNQAGSTVTLRPELWRENVATMVMSNHIVPPSMRTAVMPLNYNNRGSSAADKYGNEKYSNGENLNVAVTFSNYPQFSIVNNGYLSVMASQAHGIAQQYTSASWAQNKAMTAAQTGYDQATSGMNLTQGLSDISINTQQANLGLANQVRAQRTAVNIINTGANAAGNALAGGGVGAVASAAMGIGSEIASAAIDINANTQGANIQMAATRGQTQAQLANQGFNRDTNKAYADFAAKGDYSTAISGIQARVQDAKLTQPSQSGAMGGDAFNMVNDRLQTYVNIKMPPLDTITQIGDYWLRYGYSVNRWITVPTNLRVCERFTYWKMKSVYITYAECPEPMKNAIRGILESGVTVWSSPLDIGSVDVNINNPVVITGFPG